ncbi:redox-sensing transcriptional repressor Rex [Planctomycetota bacterium]
MRYHRIPDETVRRLPIYLRCLLSLTEEGLEKTSSQKLADSLGTNPWQIRKDFSYFGDFGTRGVGYKIDKLKKQINKILKLDVKHKAALIGAGNLGSAVLAYPGFKVYGFDIAAVFDIAPEKISRRIGNIDIEDVSNIPTLSERDIKLAILTIPLDAAQKTADALVEAGIRGILNFSPQHITVPKKVKVISIDIAMDLARLPYYMPAC